MEVSQNNNIKLSWTPYIGWEKAVKNYQLFRKLDSETGFELVDEFDGSINSCILDDPTSGFKHTYLIQAINDEYYSWSNQVSIEFEFPVSIPNVFTPNGDGVNDTFVFEYLDLYKENQFTIFDRTGKIVFNKKNYGGEWNANELNEGIYFYNFFEDKYQRTFTGWIKIVR